MASVSCSSPTLAESNTPEGAKNRAVQKVAPCGHQIQRHIPNRRLFRHAHNSLHPILVGSLHIKDAIIRHLRRLHLYRQQHRTTMLLAHPNHLTHGGGGLNEPIGKRDRGIVPVGIQEFVRIPFYSLAPDPCHAKPCFTSRCAIKAPSKGELGFPSSEYSNPLSTTTTALAALNYGSISVLMYITKAEFVPQTPHTIFDCFAKGL